MLILSVNNRRVRIAYERQGGIHVFRAEAYDVVVGHKEKERAYQEFRDKLEEVVR